MPPRKPINPDAFTPEQDKAATAKMIIAQRASEARGKHKMGSRLERISLTYKFEADVDVPMPKPVAIGDIKKFILTVPQLADVDPLMAFFSEEGLHPQSEKAVSKGKTSLIALSAEEYYKLEDKYTVPMGKESIVNTIGRFSDETHLAGFNNNSSPFAVGFSRVMKLLRDYDIPFEIKVEHKKRMNSDEFNGSIIYLTEEGHNKLKSMIKEITAKEQEHSEQLSMLHGLTGRA